jgi:hypothetical protein
VLAPVGALAEAGGVAARCAAGAVAAAATAALLAPVGTAVTLPITGARDPTTADDGEELRAMMLMAPLPIPARAIGAPRCSAK